MAPSTQAIEQSKISADTSDLPSYTTPRKGILSCLPPNLVSYAELARIDEPVGILNIYLPFFLGLFYASLLPYNTPSPSSLLSNAVFLLLSSFVLRSLGGTWNDLVNSFPDRQSTARPDMVCMAYVHRHHCIPFGKNTTNDAQVELAFALSFGTVVGSAIGNFSPLSRNKFWDFIERDALGLWALIFTTTKKAGIKGKGVKFEIKMRAILGLAAATELTLLGVVGWAFEADFT
ncbi:MAG: hypothetical protein MMC23_005129 [Stictis urceolatum]|nr:hypothetical protein [Stictis urceolata]